MQRVIGLDIGSYSIKAVEIVNTFKTYEIVRFYENVIPEIEELPMDMRYPACMEQLFKENNLEADRIVTAIPGQFISSRIMSFGFSDSRKIATAVMGELEDSVPFNLEDTIIDHQVIGNMGGKSVALVVMTRKAYLRSFLELLARIKIDPKVVDVDSLAFYNLSSYMQVEPGKVYGIVDVGHEKTSICFVRDGILRMFRSINLGGRYLSDFLARDLEVDFNEAQRIKHRVSRVLCDSDAADDLSGDDKMVVERLTLAANSIVKELGRTIFAFKRWEKAPVAELVVSGGTTRIRNFREFLEEQLEVKVVQNHLERTRLKINPELASSMEVMPQSVAIGMRAISSVKRLSQINLRKGEFAYFQDYGALLRKAGIVARIVAAALVLVTAQYGFNYFFYQRQIATNQAEFVKDLLASFPDMKKTIPGSLAFGKIRTDGMNRMNREIAQRRGALAEFVVSNEVSPPLVLLKAVSEALPKEVVVDVTMFQYNASAEEGVGGKLILRGETEGYASMTSVIEKLKTVRVLKGLEEKSSGPKPGTDNKIIEFTVHATYVPGGDDVVEKA